ncbi:MAG: LamG-like jellyroll fold domain-containing protein [Nitrospirota bacterium]
MTKITAIRIFILSFLFCLIAVQADTLDYPHNSANNITCESCHFVYGGDEVLLILPEWVNHVPETIDDTQFNTLCWSCHTETLSGPLFMETHSSRVLDNGYGDWAVECRVCHNPHKQQFRSANHGSEAYILQGTVAGVGTDTLTASGVNWGTDEYAGYVVVPNIAENKYNYQVLSNDSDTLTVKGTIDQSRVIATDTFGISYGKLVYDTIHLDKIIDDTSGGPPVTRTGTKTVKFFNNEGANSFADGDLTLDGICEACHQQTNHFRNYNPVTGESLYDRLHANMNYPAGTDCTFCHKHENGFIGMGDGAHTTHVIDDNGPKLWCGDCHGENTPPVLADGLDLASTTVCDNCHSSDGIADAKTNWHEDPGTWVSTAGEESFCGSCHDLTPGNSRQEGTGFNAPGVAGDKTNYGFFETGHGRPTASGNFENLSWQETTAGNGNPAANRSCSDCHDLTSQHFNKSMIKSVYGTAGGNQLTITFRGPVYTESTPSGNLVDTDFDYVDASGDGAASIVSVLHSAGSSTAVITLNANLIANDIGNDTLAANSDEVFDGLGDPSDTGSLTVSDIDVPSMRLRSGFENDANNSNCRQCHYSGGLAYNGPEWYTSYTGYSSSAHGTAIGSLKCTDCHDVHGAAAGQSASVQYPGMTTANQETLCYQCHKDQASGGIQNFAVTGFRGTHDGADDQLTVLTDSTAKYAGILINVLSGWTVYNLTDGSKGTITDHNLTQITTSGFLSGGIENDWDNGDAYHIAMIDDIQQAFNLSSSHNLGTGFDLGSNNYTLECVSCHNVHLVTGKHWDADQGKSPVTRFASNLDVWGDESGEKMQDFAFGTANGYYQPPEGDHFTGTELPDYVTFCTDCHSQLVLGVVGQDGTGHGINWGQAGIFGPYVITDKHGLPLSGQSAAGGCPDTYYCDKTNNYPRTTYNGWPSSPPWPMYMAGRGRANWTLMPYDTAERFAGVKNYVLSCTDCHEAHGSATVRRMGRAITNGATASINVMGNFCSNCHFMNGGHHNIPQGGCGNGGCHGSWSPTTNDSLHNMNHDSGSPGAGALYNYDLVLDMRFENNLNDSGAWNQHGQWAADGDGAGAFSASHDGGGNALLIETQPYTNPGTGNPTSGIGAFVEPGSTNGGWSTDGTHRADRFFSFKYSLSFESWIYPTDYPALDNGDGVTNPTPNRFIISKATYGNYADYAMLLRYIDSDYRLYFRGNVNANANGASDDYGWRGAYSSVAIPLNQWTHVAVTYDASELTEDHDANDLAKGRIRIYVNGEDVTTNQVPSTNNYDRTQPLDGEGEGANPDTGNGLNPCIDNGQCQWRMVIGSLPYDKTLVHFIGKIDDVKMWNVTKDANYFDVQVPPLITLVEGISGNDKLYVTFSESVYGSGVSNELITTDFVLNDVSGNGALGISTVSHTAGDTTAVLTLSGNLAIEDIDTDTLEPAASSIYDEYGSIAAFTDGLAIIAKVNAPTLDMVNGTDGHNRIVIRFSESIYTNSNGTGTLQPTDFAYSDVSGNSITSVEHTLDRLEATLVLDGDVNAVDIDAATLTPLAGAVFDVTGYPVNITPVTLTQGLVSSISAIEGVENSNVLKVTFESQVYSAVNETGSLDASDFVYVDTNGEHTSQFISSVTHSGGSPVAIITMNENMIPADFGADTLAAVADSIFGPGDVSFPLDAADTVTITAQTAPTLTRVEGADGYDKLFVAFSEGVYTGAGQAGALTTADFVDSDAVWDISGVQHIAGQANAILTLTAALDAGDIGTETIDVAGSTSVYNNTDNPVATGSAVTIAGYDCPTWGSTFDFNDGTGSSTVTDDTTLLEGTVGNPLVSMLGDNLYTGDETEAEATYIDINSGANYDKCLQTGRAYTIETRFYAGDVDMDYVDVDPVNGLDDDYDVYNTPNDQDGDGRTGTYSRIMERQNSYFVTLMRAGYAGDYMSKRAGKARIEFKYRRDDASLHTCPHPQWPEDQTYTGDSSGQHQISSDIGQWPIIDNHWYRIRVVFNSDKINIAGSNGNPVDIFFDDQGETGLDDATEQWSGLINVSKAINDSSSCRWGALPGDYMRIIDRFTYIGDNSVHTDIPNDVWNLMLKGKLDWLSWKPYADYTGVTPK